MPCPSMWPKQFLSNQIDLDLTIMIWSWPKLNGHDLNELVRSKFWLILVEITIWTWSIHFDRDHFILVMTKSLWSSTNQFGQTKTILDWPKLFWSHRKTRHQCKQNKVKQNLIMIFVLYSEKIELKCSS